MEQLYIYARYFAYKVLLSLKGASVRAQVTLSVRLSVRLPVCLFVTDFSSLFRIFWTTPGYLRVFWGYTVSNQITKNLF